MIRFPFRISYILPSLREKLSHKMATLIGTNDSNPNIQEVSFKLPWGILAGKLWGNPKSEKNILAIHGWLENSGSFDRLVPLLFANELFASQYSILAIDLAGHGFSSHRDDGVPYTMMNNVVDVKHVLNQIGWKKFSILGHSMGGAISTLLSIGLVGQVEHLITIDAVVPAIVQADQYLDILKDIVVPNASSIYSIPDGFKVYPTMEAIFARILEGNVYLNEDAAKVLAIRGTKAVDNGFTFTRDLRIKARGPFYFLANSYQEFIIEILQHLTLPTLCILPTESHVRIDEALTDIDLPENFIKKYVSGNHQTHTNTPEVVAPVILDFLNFT